jgi:hypothetical protein
MTQLHKQKLQRIANVSSLKLKINVIVLGSGEVKTFDSQDSAKTFSF